MVDRLHAEDLTEKSLRDLFSMIPERLWHGESRSRIEMVVGPMFSGKTEEMIRRTRRAKIARQDTHIFKPIIDVRYGGTGKVNSHSGLEDDAIPVEHARDILINLISRDDLKDTLVVGIDEVQFFDKEIVSVVRGLKAKGFRVIMAGLNLDFRGEPFGQMPELLSISEEMTKLHAICTVCGRDADYTQRIINGKYARYDDPIIFVGAAEAYEVRCDEDHIVPGRPSLVPKQGE